jgi:hypothetical protein
LVKVIWFIVNICLNDVDPRLNEYSCVSDVVHCYGVEHQDIEVCIDYWKSNKSDIGLSDLDRSY